MEISQETVSALESVISGNSISGGNSLTPYRSGPDLVHFFNQFGANDEYGQGFPSRWVYTEGVIEKFNGTAKLELILEAADDPRRFIQTEYAIEDVIAYLNSFLRYDGYCLCEMNEVYKVRPLSKPEIGIDLGVFLEGSPNIEFIHEQLSKCESKLSDGDFDGAITNSRSLLEAILLEMEHSLSGEQNPYDGDLPKLYRRVLKKLNLDPSRKDISDSLKQVLSGLISVVAGLSSLRNRMSDAHVRSYRPSEHHARLVVNASRTISDFLCQTYVYQIKAGFISAKGRKP